MTTLDHPCPLVLQPFSNAVASHPALEGDTRGALAHYDVNNTTTDNNDNITARNTTIITFKNTTATTTTTDDDESELALGSATDFLLTVQQGGLTSLPRIVRYLDRGMDLEVWDSLALEEFQHTLSPLD